MASLSHYMTNTILCAEDIKSEQNTQGPCPYGTYILGKDKNTNRGLIKYQTGRTMNKNSRARERRSGWAPGQVSFFSNSPCLFARPRPRCEYVEVGEGRHFFLKSSFLSLWHWPRRGRRSSCCFGRQGLQAPWPTGLLCCSSMFPPTVRYLLGFSEHYAPL